MTPANGPSVFTTGATETVFKPTTARLTLRCDGHGRQSHGMVLRLVPVRDYYQLSPKSRIRKGPESGSISCPYAAVVSSLKGRIPAPMPARAPGRPFKPSA